MNTLTRSQVMALIQGKQAGRSLRAFAKELKVSAAYLSDLYRGNRDPGPTILTIFGLKRTKTVVVEYTRTPGAPRRRG